MMARLWLAVCAAAVVLALAAALGVQTVRLSHAQTDLATAQADYANERARAADAARKQEARYRQLEGEHRVEIANHDAQAAAQLALVHADLDDARAAGEQLQHAVSNYVAAVRSAAADCTAAGQCEAGADPLVLLAELRAAADARAGELAATADAARVRGSACEQSYDSARAMIERATGEAQLSNNP